MVAFLIGCSFTFETALVENGIKLEHIEQGRNVAMYRTSTPTVPAGMFSGPQVLSLSPIPAERVADAVRTTSCFTYVHVAQDHEVYTVYIDMHDVTLQSSQ